MLPTLLNHLQSPVRYGWVNFAGHPGGDALDIGWLLKYGNANQDLFGPGEMQVLDSSWFDDGGNTITLGANYDKVWDVWLSVMHMLNRSPLSVGQVIGRNTKIGNMGNTGQSKGEHAHIRLTFVPKGTPFSWGTYSTSKRYNPYDYIYRTKDMDVLDMKDMPSGWTNGGTLVKESGTITVIEPDGMVMRKAPVRDSGNVVGGLKKGQSMKYTHKIASDGHMWVTDGKVYVASRTLDYKTIFVDVDGKPLEVPGQSKPTPPKPNKPSRVGQILVVRDSYPHATFTAYEDKACTKPLRPWTIANYDHNLTFKVVEDHDPVFKCVQYSLTPMSGVDHVWIKWEPGIGFDK